MKALYEYLLENIKSRKVTTTIRREIKEIVKEKDHNSFEDALKKFSKAVYMLLMSKECPEPLQKIYDSQSEDFDSQLVFDFGLEEPIPLLLSSTIFTDLNDVLSLEFSKS